MEELSSLAHSPTFWVVSVCLQIVLGIVVIYANRILDKFAISATGRLRSVARARNLKREERYRVLQLWVDSEPNGLTLLLYSAIRARVSWIGLNVIGMLILIIAVLMHQSTGNIGLNVLSRSGAILAALLILLGMRHLTKYYQIEEFLSSTPKFLGNMPWPLGSRVISSSP